MSHTVRATWALWGRSGYLTGSRSHSFQLHDRRTKDREDEERSNWWQCSFCTCVDQTSSGSCSLPVTSSENHQMTDQLFKDTGLRLTSTVCWMPCTRCGQAKPEVFHQQTPDRWHRGRSSSPGKVQRTAALGLRAALCSFSAPAFLPNCLCGWMRTKI